MSEDQRTPKSVPSLVKLAYNAFSEEQREEYRTDYRTLPKVDLRYCCEALFQMLTINSSDGMFDENGDRRLMYDKVQATVGLNVYYSLICDAAALFGHVECLKLAKEMGCPWSSSTFLHAVVEKQLECVIFLHENGCEWNSQTCEFIACVGHLACLVYAHEHGCIWNKKTCAAAAETGQLACLKYAHEHGCPWDEETCSNALQNGHISCFNYARQHGCPWRDDDDSADR